MIYFRDLGGNQRVLSGLLSAQIRVELPRIFSTKKNTRHAPIVAKSRRYFRVYSEACLRCFGVGSVECETRIKGLEYAWSRTSR